jgi:hypothetical protein
LVESMIVEILKRLIFDLVNEDYNSIFDDGRNGKLTREEIIRALDEYGGKLTCPQNDAYLSDSLNIIEIKNNEIYHVEFELWIDNERSDLSLICKVIFKGKDVMELTIEDIHVL